MPIARVRLPDGRIGRFNVPEGTTPEQVLEFAREQGLGQDSGPPDSAPVTPEQTRQPLSFAQQFQRVPEFIQETGPIQAGLISAGGAMQQMGTGAQRLFALATGDEKEAARCNEMSMMQETSAVNS